MSTINNIEKISASPNDVIVIRFGYDDIVVDGVRVIYDQVQKVFPENSVIMIPNNVHIESCDKESLMLISSMIDDVIAGIDQKKKY